MHNLQKEWSIFIYLNGNNELEPEMWNTKVDIEKINSKEKVNIVLQFAREERKIAQIMRPQDNISEIEENWTGVRRLYIENNTSRLIEDLGKINMADYMNLNEFLVWGIKTYPAKKIMVIIAGHGFMVASLSDLTGKEPKTMGLYEMCTAINAIKNDIGVKIDVLVLDICYMNNIELVYELGKNKENTVKNILTFMESGPIEGLCYSKLISYLINNEYNTEVSKILKILVNNLNENLIAIEVNCKKLFDIKELYNKIGYLLLSKLMDNKIYDDEFIINSKINMHYEEVERLVKEIIISYNEKTKGERKLLNIFDRYVYNIENKDSFLKFYNNLEFSKNNYWGNYVAGKSIEEELNNIESKSSQYTLSKDNIYAFIKIFNFNFLQSKIDMIIDQLYKYKNW